MIVVGYKIDDAGWGRKYRRVTDKEQQLAIRTLTGRTHIPWKDIEAFAQLNVFFHENGHPMPDEAVTLDGSPHPDKYYTHMRGEHADGATQ
jgi:hypothetical protein